ncbi:LysR family transcriptional regulator [Moritella viscosa]|uniref:Transcriptional regulator n=1 Tax=Moritella viscosa TaxID=80854 RepID=A0A090IGY8_9GAMM|nr:LysR substrate-binding domain-containing protein [Moritella viscosa]CED61506.1 HTH-type transcriptional regulator, LysR family [Moritella viscosa]SGY89292.1 Putative transcriptional regulator [Moritella viscosa]SGY97119.1 Putative transcriptional regulator [Moritella viscosa]SGY97253.1 Putative transcriptional regulator [Moritella viscosa]SHO04647.1 Putative transcriptional regulator [Moritella viscosa]
MRHLKAFHVFHVAAALESYSKAANKLCITHGAVSKQIKTLETHLAVNLFYREGRNVKLMPAGKLLSGYTEQAFNALEAGVQHVTQVTHTHLEVSCEPTLTMRWLMPRLSDFYQENVDVDVRLSTAGGPVILGSNGLSLAIRRDDFPLLHDYQQTPLVEEWVGPVFSPEYWQQVQNDAGKIKLLHSQTRPQAWDNCLQDSAASCLKVQSLKVQSEQTFAHFYFCLQAVVDNLGAAIGSYPLVMDDLQRGNLVAPFGFTRSGHRYMLLSQDDTLLAQGNTLLGKDSQQNVLQRNFINWLQLNLAACVPNQ